MLDTILGIIFCLFAGGASIAIHQRAIQMAHHQAPEKSYVKGGRGLHRSVGLLIVAHLLEIFVFAFFYWALNALSDYSELTGAMELNARDYIYFSATAYTSLGLGDILPNGAMRILTSVETLIGLIMIAWTAAFLFSETSD